MEDILVKLLKQEEELQFESFTSEDAWKLGSLFVDKGRAGSLPITVDITRHGHQLFHYSFEGTSPDNDQWVIRKRRLVNRFGHSSYYWNQFLNNQGTSIEDRMLVSEQEYAPHGGCFPLIMKNAGPVGTITVSGLAQEEDHNLVVSVLSEFLELQG